MRRPRTPRTLRTPRARDERGVALITVLAVIAFTSLVIGALFGLLSTTMRVTTAAETTAREGRAADSAIDTAVNRMRTEPCSGLEQLYVEDQQFDQGTPGDGDDVSVDVICRPQGGAGGSGADQVRLIGDDGYQGASSWRNDCTGAQSPPNCLPWSTALGSVPTGLDGSAALIHSGHDALSFAAGVSVRSGAAALRTDDGGDPAIRIGGEYRQGALGIGASAGAACGVLSGEPGSGRGRVEATGGAVCDDDTIAALLLETGGTITGPPAPAAQPAIPACTSGAVIRFSEGTYDSAGTSQVSAMLKGTAAACRNKTFHFQPGIYSFTGTLLEFGDAGSYYVFGAPNGWDPNVGLVGSPLGAQADAQLCDPGQSGASLVINGWTEVVHTAGRVAVCPSIPESIDGSPLEPHPAIYQQPAVSGSVSVASIDKNPPVTGTDGINAIRNISSPFECRLGLPYPALSDVTGAGVCLPQRRYEMTLATEGQGPVNSLRIVLTGKEAGSRPKEAGSRPLGDGGAAGDLNDLVRARATRFVVFRGSGGLLCQTDVGFGPGMPNSDMPSAFDLKALGGSCQSNDITLSDLDGARVVVVHRMQLDRFLLLYTPTVFLAVNGAEAEVNASVGSTGQVLAGDADWNNVDAVRSPAGAASPKMQDCETLFCPVADPGRSMVRVEDSSFVHELSLGDFSFSGALDPLGDGSDPAVTTLRALVSVDPTTASLPPGWTNPFNVANWVRPHTVHLELRTPDGGRCITPGGGLNSAQQWSFDLMNPANETPGAADCNNLALDTLDDLDDVELTLRFESTCVPVPLDNLRGECLRSLLYNPADTAPVWQMRPPDVRLVQLTAQTDTYIGPPPNSLVTVDARSGASASSFHVFGQTWMPLSDLDLHWKGDAVATPLFANDLILNGLASRMATGASMGIVCCSPPDSRRVDLVAIIDGIERLVQTVDFIDVAKDGSYAPGYAVDVLEHRTCGRGGCASVLGNNQENPAVVDPP